MPHRGRLVKFPDLHPSPIERNSRYRAKRSIRGGWLRRRPAKIDTNGRHDAAAGLQESCVTRPLCSLQVDHVLLYGNNIILVDMIGYNSKQIRARSANPHISEYRMFLPHALKEYDSNVALIMIAHENTYGRKSSNI